METSCSTRVKQVKISNVFQSKEAQKIRAEKINQSLAKMIAEDMLPLAFVEGNGFINFMRIVDPAYTIPSRNTVLQRINLLYYKVKNTVIENIAKLDWLSVTTDCWTSRKTEPYITVTVHGITDDWKFARYTLATRGMPERHTAQNLSRKLDEVLEEYNIKDKIVAVVHDNAANITNAVRAGSYESVSCLAHTLQLCLNKGLQDDTTIKTLLVKCSSIVGHFKHSTVAKRALEQLQKTLGVPQHCLIQHVKTRWNSSFYMLQRLCEQRQAVQGVLGDRATTSKQQASQFELAESDWSLMEGLEKVLKPFDTATNLISGEKYPTISIVQPLVQSLLQNFLTISATDSIYIQKFKKTVTSEFKTRFNILDDSIGDRYTAVTLLDKATFLDPRYKGKERCFGILHKVKVNLEEEILRFEGDHVNDVPIAEKNATAIDILFPEEELEQTSMSEISKYCIESTINKNSDVLQWWKNNGTRYPLTATLAKKYLCVQATSTASERVFSSAGHIINAKRNCLKTDNADKLIFLSQNYKFM